MDNIKALSILYPNIKIDAKGCRGFKRDGWAIWAPGTGKEYLVHPDKWTDNKSEARVFDCIETAVAVCESHQFFSCSTRAEVVRASKEPE